MTQSIREVGPGDSQSGKWDLVTQSIKKVCYVTDSIREVCSDDSVNQGSGF